MSAHAPPAGRGPGVLIVAASVTPSLEARAAYLAEEGYVTLAAPAQQAQAAFEQLGREPARLGKLAVIAYGPGPVDLPAGVSAAVLYDVHAEADCPSVQHFAVALRESAGDGMRVARYAYKECRAGFADPDSPFYDRYHAAIAYSRSLGLLRRELGPHYNLGDLWDRHLECEFILKDATENMKTMVAQPYVNHVPTMTGGVGHDLLKRFYTWHFIHQAPPDRRTIPVSRTVGPDRVIEEKVFCFTHTIEMDWLLPGVKPTGRYVELPLVVVVSFRGDKLYNEHIYWDQASLLAQVGLIDPAGLPVAGVEQARKLLDPALPSNTLMPAWKTSEGKPV